MAISIGLIFFFIVALDHPFAGGSAVDPDPFVELLTRYGVSIAPRN